VGAVIIALIYLWGMRARIQEELRRRRRSRQAEHEPFLDIGAPPGDSPPPTEASGYGFDKFGSISIDHPLAKQILVDVEITPVQRPRTEAVESAGETPEQAGGSPPDSASEEGIEPPAAAQHEAQPEPQPVTPATAWEEGIEPTGEQPRGAAVPRQPPKEPDLQNECKMTVLLTVMANPRKLFEGPTIMEVTRTMGMTLHKSGVFDCCAEAPAGGKPVFSVAHLREPGTFDAATLETLATPGLLLLMNLPGPLEPLAALNFMLDRTQQLAERLGGHIGDENRNRMTNQRLGHLRREIIEFDRQLRLQKPRY
jgi:cell division protein ZipA